MYSVTGIIAGVL